MSASATVQDSVTAALDTRLTAIEASEDSVHAWVQLDVVGAKREAERLDALAPAERDALPLAGVTLGVKDIIHVDGFRTEAGSRILQGFEPHQDAPVVASLRAAGVIVLGKTVTTEFASADPGATRNPLDLDRTPGGSSSGSAAAVAAGHTDLALGTQTAGSVLRPAAYCGVYGFKPTYDTLSREGVLPLGWSMDHVGILGSDPALIAAAFAVAAGRPQAEAWTAPVRFGIADRHFTDAQPGMLAALARVIDLVGEHGWDSRALTLPTSFEAAVAAGTLILPVEIATAHAERYPGAEDQYGPRLRTLIEIGRRISAPDYLRAQRARAVAAADFARMLADVDVLLTPTVPDVAPLGLASTGDPRFLTPISLFGLPSLTVPLAMAGPLPAAVQIVGRAGEDDTVLAIGQALAETIRGTDLHRAAREDGNAHD
ncbi:amidase [Microbacterium gorillae]|uniref:amidase n=1 Tax=Microbacterium gorillae TaxID=1231063 RepID=UPI0006945EEC|nr:amidase [Microbacterium gorillae]